MRNALKALIILTALAATACHKQAQPQAGNDAMSLDDNVGTSQPADNAQIETLPPDESSTTSSRELQNGQDNPDVNNLGNGD
jgi:hypothetical protein